jgi:hypothetical protein
MNEGFIELGYEFGAAWTEYLGSGATLDEDASLPGSPPAGSCTEGLLTQSAGVNNYTCWDRGSSFPSATNMDYYFEIYLDSSAPMTAYSNASLAIQTNSMVSPAGGSVWILRYQENGGHYEINLDGATPTGWKTITRDGWHTIHVHQNATAASSYMTIDGGTQYPFKWYSGSTRYFCIGAVSGWATGENLKMYVGRIWMNSP